MLPSTFIPSLPQKRTPSRLRARTPKVISKHSSYYLSGGDLYLLIDNVMFRVHRYFFERESVYFQEWFETAKTNLNMWDGHSFERPIAPPNSFNITAEDVSHFLWIFYNPKYSLYNTASRATWMSILRCAEFWEFPEVKALAYREIAALSDTHVDTDVEHDSDSDDLPHDGDNDNVSVPSRRSPSLEYVEASTDSPVQEPTGPVRIPHPDHPYGVDAAGVPYFLEHRMERNIR
jgi:hypothetical protein